MSQEPSGVVQGKLDKGVFAVNAGSLFPALRRLERQGLIEDAWRAAANNRRAKDYLLTKRGRKKLRSEAREWQTQGAAIARILQVASGERCCA